VKIKKLPKECSAFVFDGVICEEDYEISYAWIPEDLGNKQFIINISRYLVLFISYYNFYNKLGILEIKFLIVLKR